MVEGEGFEPSKAEPSDLQSDPFDRSGTPPRQTRIMDVLLFQVNKLLILLKETNRNYQILTYFTVGLPTIDASKLLIDTVCLRALTKL